MKNLKTVCVVMLLFLIACGDDNILPKQNAAPTATNVLVALQKKQVEGSYKYLDKENDTEGTALFQWYRAEDANGTNAVKIANATGKTYIYTAEDNDKYLAFEVTPFQKDGKKGVAVKSKFVGKVVFEFPNTVPTVKDVLVALENKKAVGSYTYSDKENDAEGKSLFQWYKADAANGTNAVKIANATGKTYTYTAEDNDKYLAFEVTPIQKDGKKGVAVKSKFVGKVVFNTVPTVTDVQVTLEGKQAVGSYTYSDKENDAEGTSLYQWYRADDANGTNAVKIANATGKTYTYTAEDDYKYLAFEVLPVQKDGKKGAAVKSDFMGEVLWNNNANNGEASKGYISVYAVSGNTITLKENYNVVEGLKAYQDDTAKHQELWKQVLKVVPESYLSKINEFVIFAGNFDSDAVTYGMLGYVAFTNRDLTTWQFGLAIDLAYATNFDDPDEGLNGTIVHEFGHIVTLNNEQINPYEDNCTTHSIDEGCFRDSSYLYQFYKNYWKDVDTSQEVSDRYYNNPDSYVSDYAATNIVEDYAETFRYYTLGSIPTDNTVVKNKKIIELSGQQSLQKLRTYIRSHVEKTSFYARKKTYKLGNFRGCGTQKMLLKHSQNR